MSWTEGRDDPQSLFAHGDEAGDRHDVRRDGSWTIAQKHPRFRRVTVDLDADVDVDAQRGSRIDGAMTAKTRNSANDASVMTDTGR